MNGETIPSVAEVKMDLMELRGDVLLLELLYNREKDCPLQQFVLQRTVDYIEQHAEELSSVTRFLVNHQTEDTIK